MLAKSAATLDRLSGGRVELGLGTGAFWEGIGAWGGPVRTGPESVDALIEAIEIIRRVWAGERGITVEGEHYEMRGGHGGPDPAHDIGIWLGAYGPRMVRTVGRLADGWVPSLPRLPLEEVPAKQDAIDEAARKAGRDPAAIRRVANLNGVIGDGDGWLRGPAEHWVEEITKLARDLRFDGFVAWFDHEDQLGQTELFATEVAPAGARGARRVGSPHAQHRTTRASPASRAGARRSPTASPRRSPARLPPPRTRSAPSSARRSSCSRCTTSSPASPGWRRLRAATRRT